MKPVPKQLKNSLRCLLIYLLVISSNITIAQVNFSADTTSGCAPILVSFTDNSSGNPTEWRWDLGNGTFSNLSNPSAIYVLPGQYTVKLIVKAGDNQDSVVKTNYITVFQAPVVNFHADVTNGCNPFMVNFSDSTNAGGTGISSWQWDFGDGVISSLQQPSHKYILAGHYGVTLRVMNSHGCVSNLRKPELIKNSGVTAGFSNKEFSTCISDKIIFQNTSVGSSSFVSDWDFGSDHNSKLTNPTYTYPAGGSYAVKLKITNQEGCADSIIKNLEVLGSVSAYFTADKLLACKAPQIINFNSRDKNGNSFLWDFDDGTTSTLPNPSHIFSDTGNYSVKLIVKNNRGCSDSLRIKNYIKIQKPFINFDKLPDSGCLSLTKTLSAVIISSEIISSYIWTFGDGSTSPEATPTHTFSKPGYYDISLVATGANGCTDTATMPKAIRVTQKPVAAFSATMLNGCAYNPVHFTNLSTGLDVSFLWDFGDKTFSAEKNPVHVYKDTGWKSIRLVAISGGCSDTSVIKKYIYLKPSVARFEYFTNCINPYKIALVNTSIGADRWLWNFGDGFTSSVMQASHTYAKQGIYTITLETWDDSTGCYYLKSKQVNILDVTPTFFVSDSSVCKGDTVRFYSPLTNKDIGRFFWDFGDGTSVNSLTNNIKHAYPKPGIYSVRLITLSVTGCRDTLIKSMYIKVNGPKANFGASELLNCANASVIFKDSSSADIDNPIRKWVWNYGDGKIDTILSGPFQHTYLVGGNYPVLLKLIDSKGCTDTFRLKPALKVNKVIAKFMAPDSLVCPNSPVRFICPFATPGVTYHWDFGDGTTASKQLPVHQYTTAGVYTVKLYVRDVIGCEDSSVIINAVRVVQTTASFDLSDSFRTCPPLLIAFTNHSVNAIDEYWDFGDSSYTNAHNPSHFYSYPGIYTATLFARGPGGCTQTMKHNIVVKGPKGKLTYDPLKLCKPYQVNLKATSEDAVSYIWDFNDGITLSSTDSIITHTYQDSGRFVPKIILVDNAGCKVPLTGRDTITNLFANVSFTFPDRIFCENDSILFKNITSSNDPVRSYSWKFGDSITSAQREPAHHYVLPGAYYPSLSVTTQYGCNAEYKSPFAVTVGHAPSFSMITGSNGCAPLTTALSAVQTDTDTSSTQWNWNFGNGMVSQLKNPLPQTYHSAGNYTVSLTASNSSGCSKTIQQVIEAYALPVLHTLPDMLLCRGKVAHLQATGAAKYQWAPAEGLSCDTCAATSAAPVVSTTYIVTGISLNGCAGKDTVAINVQQPFEMTYSKPGKVCAGQSIRLQADGASTYQWFPPEGLSNTTIANPVAQPNVTTSYRVIGSDNKGCFKDTGYINLTVNPVPVVDAGPDKTIMVGMPLDLQLTYSNDVTDVKWSPTDGVFRQADNAITVKPVQNTEYTAEVKNLNGCSAKDKVTVFVTCNNNNVFIPNFFSPNADGINDKFYPRGTGLFKIKNMIIFNRWGAIVFEKKSFNANDVSAGWDGTYKGTKLTSDVYVYVIELICDNSSVLSLKGNVALVN